LRLSAVTRVSRVGDRGGDSFMSPDEQAETIKAWAKSNGAVIVAWHDETDSVSGRTTNRAGLKAALREAETGKSDGVIVARVDRFARNLTEGLAAVKRLHDDGKYFVAVRDGVNSADPKDRMGKMALTLLLMFAEWQLDTASDYWEITKRRHIGNGVATNPAYGYRKGPDRRLVPYPPEAKVVRLIFEKRAKGWSWSQIATHLNDKGIPTSEPRVRKNAQPGEGDNRPIAKSWVNMMLPSVVARRTYLGELNHGEFINRNAHKPIVSQDLWDRAHAMAKTPGKSGREAFLLTGLVRCGACGGRMSGLTHVVPATPNRPSYTIFYYKCRMFYSWGRCPAPQRVQAVELEKLVVQAFEERFLARAGSDASAETSAELADAITTRREAEAELRAFRDSPVTNRMGDELGREWVDEGMEVRLDAVKTAREAEAQARTAELGASLPPGLVDAWERDELDDEERRTAMAGVIAVIGIKPVPRQARVPVEERFHIWAHGERGAPENLPGRGRRNNAITPIPFK
jgi:site-specific DNA recombinase